MAISQHFSEEESLRIAAMPESRNYRLTHPSYEGEIWIPALSPEMAKKMAQDEVAGLKQATGDWTDWEVQNA